MRKIAECEEKGFWKYVRKERIPSGNDQNDSGVSRSYGIPWPLTRAYSR
jgi:hypothetical protein